MKIFRILSLLLALVLLASFVACDSEKEPNANETSGEQTTAETEAPTEADTEPQTDPSNDGNVRVLIASDLHYTYLETYFGLPAEDRMQHFVDSVLLEHKNQPIDLLIIAGDTSLDHWFTKGSWTKDKISTTKTLYDNYLTQITAAGIPMFVLAGNHEQFNNEQWEQFVGNKRYGSVAVEGNLFIMLDAFSVDLEPNYDNDPSYANHDVAFIKEQMELHPECKNVYLVSHYFDYKNESAAFKEVVRDPRIKGLFQGHTHTNKVINMGEDYLNKTIAETGHFAHFGSANVDENTLKNNFWGFRELSISPEMALSRMIIVETTIKINGVSIMDLKRTTLNTVRYY